MFLSLIYSLMYRYNSYIFLLVTGFVALVCESSRIPLYGQCTIMGDLSFQSLWNMKLLAFLACTVVFPKIIWLLNSWSSINCCILMLSDFSPSREPLYVISNHWVSRVLVEVLKTNFQHILPYVWLKWRIYSSVIHTCNTSIWSFNK